MAYDLPQFFDFFWCIKDGGHKSVPTLRKSTATFIKQTET